MVCHDEDWSSCKMSTKIQIFEILNQDYPVQATFSVTIRSVKQDVNPKIFLQLRECVFLPINLTLFLGVTSPYGVVIKRRED